MIRYRRMLLLPLDAALVALSYILAYLVRFEGHLPQEQWLPFWLGLSLSLAIKPLCFVVGGFYRRLWRYASIPDLLHIIKTVSISCLIALISIVFLSHFSGFSRSIPILDWVFLNVLILGRSLAWRVVREERLRRRSQAGAPVLIVGAGAAGRMLLQEIRNNPDLGHDVVGFLDDDPAKVGARVNEVPVLGRIGDLRRIARYRGVQQVIIAIPSAPSRVIRSVVHACQREDLSVQTLPPIVEILDSRRLTAQLREVRLEDLLGREPVKLDTDQISSYLTGRRILVTGAGGSIGSEICRQVARFAPAQLQLMEMAETPLHLIQLELQRLFPKLSVTPVLSDIRDPAQVNRSFESLRPQVVFHAAAYKHVPMMEFHPLEAVKSNVFGSRNLCEAAMKTGVERFVMISTDKAVNPTNVMGASKRAAERVVQAFREGSSTEFVTVRFGNVLGSNGSVVPLFRDQIARGGPVTVTHPEVTRYFMTIPEASQLVLQAGSMGGAGEIFLLDMGSPVKIIDLAKELIRLSGLEPDKDIEIVYTGLRPGEKLFEELLINGENIKPTQHPTILIAAAAEEDPEFVNLCLKELAFCVRSGNQDLAVQTLARLVPEYRGRAELSKSQLKIHPSALDDVAPAPSETG